LSPRGQGWTSLEASGDAKSATEEVAAQSRWRRRPPQGHALFGRMLTEQNRLEAGIAEHLLFYWRKRLRNQQQPMRFALVEHGAASAGTVAEPALELVLNTGERLRIGSGVDQTALRTVLAALCV
jgi:hypothetical protein